MDAFLDAIDAVPSFPRPVGGVPPPLRDTNGLQLFEQSWKTIDPSELERELCAILGSDRGENLATALRESECGTQSLIDGLHGGLDFHPDDRAIISDILEALTTSRKYLTEISTRIQSGLDPVEASVLSLASKDAARSFTATVQVAETLIQNWVDNRTPPIPLENLMEKFGEPPPTNCSVQLQPSGFASEARVRDCTLIDTASSIRGVLCGEHAKDVRRRPFVTGSTVLVDGQARQVPIGAAYSDAWVPHDPNFAQGMHSGGTSVSWDATKLHPGNYYVLPLQPGAKVVGVQCLKSNGTPLDVGGEQLYITYFTCGMATLMLPRGVDSSAIARLVVSASAGHRIPKFENIGITPSLDICVSEGIARAIERAKTCPQQRDRIALICEAFRTEDPYYSRDDNLKAAIVAAGPNRLAFLAGVAAGNCSTLTATLSAYLHLAGVPNRIVNCMCTNPDSETILDPGHCFVEAGGIKLDPTNWCSLSHSIAAPAATCEIVQAIIERLPNASPLEAFGAGREFRGTTTGPRVTDPNSRGHQLKDESTELTTTLLSITAAEFRRCAPEVLRALEHSTDGKRFDPFLRAIRHLDKNIPDRSLFTLIFDVSDTLLGPGTPLTDNERCALTCTLLVSVLPRLNSDEVKSLISTLDARADFPFRNATGIITEAKQAAAAIRDAPNLNSDTWNGLIAHVERLIIYGVESIERASGTGNSNPEASLQQFVDTASILASHQLRHNLQGTEGFLRRESRMHALAMRIANAAPLDPLATLCGMPSGSAKSIELYYVPLQLTAVLRQQASPIRSWMGDLIDHSTGFLSPTVLDRVFSLVQNSEHELHSSFHQSLIKHLREMNGGKLDLSKYRVPLTKMLCAQITTRQPFLACPTIDNPFSYLAFRAGTDPRLESLVHLIDILDETSAIDTETLRAQWPNSKSDVEAFERHRGYTGARFEALVSVAVLTVPPVFARVAGLKDGRGVFEEFRRVFGQPTSETASALFECYKRYGDAFAHIFLGPVKFLDLDDKARLQMLDRAVQFSTRFSNSRESYSLRYTREFLDRIKRNVDGKGGEQAFKRLGSEAIRRLRKHMDPEPKSSDVRAAVEHLVKLCALAQIAAGAYEEISEVIKRVHLFDADTEHCYHTRHFQLQGNDEIRLRLLYAGWQFAAKYMNKWRVAVPHDAQELLLPSTKGAAKRAFKALSSGVPGSRRTIAPENDADGSRQFRTGDNARSIDWALTARRGKTMVREYREMVPTKDERVHLTIDQRLLSTAEGERVAKYLELIAAAIRSDRQISVEIKCGRLSIANFGENYLADIFLRAELEQIRQFRVELITHGNAYQSVIQSREETLGIDVESILTLEPGDPRTHLVAASSKTMRATAALYGRSKNVRFV